MDQTVVALDVTETLIAEFAEVPAAVVLDVVRACWRNESGGGGATCAALLAAARRRLNQGSSSTGT